MRAIKRDWDQERDSLMAEYVSARAAGAEHTMEAVNRKLVRLQQDKLLAGYAANRHRRAEDVAWPGKIIDESHTMAEE